MAEVSGVLEAAVLRLSSIKSTLLPRAGGRVPVCQLANDRINGFDLDLEFRESTCQNVENCAVMMLTAGSGFMRGSNMRNRRKH